MCHKKRHEFGVYSAKSPNKKWHIPDFYIILQGSQASFINVVVLLLCQMKTVCSNKEHLQTLCVFIKNQKEVCQNILTSESQNLAT